MSDDFEINDDLQVTEEYKDVEAKPRPPLPGNYLFKAAKWDFLRNKDGEIVKWKVEGQPTYPVFNLVSAEILDPFEYSRGVGLFQQIPTYPLEREGMKVSPAADLLRSMDSDAVARNTGEVIRLVTDNLNGGTTFRARLDYAAYDSEYAKQLIESAGGKDQLNNKELNKLYSKAKVRGYRNIQKTNLKAGRTDLPLHKWISPAGNVIEVRPVLTVFYPTKDDVTLGPDKNLL